MRTLEGELEQTQDELQNASEEMLKLRAGRNKAEKDYFSQMAHLGRNMATGIGMAGVGVLNSTSVADEIEKHKRESRRKLRKIKIVELNIFKNIQRRKLKFHMKIKMKIKNEN